MKLNALLHRHRDALWAGSLFGCAWLLYALTAAPGTIYGDPSEYQFIPAIWGIAHPPGYAFYTLLAGVWQRCVPIGSVAFRTNLLAGAVAAWAVSRIFLVVLHVGRSVAPARKRDVLPAGAAPWAALIAGVAWAVAPDLWQHAIHANAHVVSVALTTTQLWLLVRWSQTGRDRWLFALAFFAGLGVTHHPITIWGLPAYAVFILVNRPRLLMEPRTLLPFVAFGLLGLAPWLYFPLRSPHVPFGPTDMGGWEGFLRHATAQGLRVNLFYFGPADQLDRLRVFWSLLRLQYPWPLLVLVGVGAVALVKWRPHLALLWGLFLLGHLSFTLNSVQDVMAYLLHPFAALAVPLGMGALALLRVARERPPLPKWAPAAAALALLALPAGAAIRHLPRISLRGWAAPDAFVDALLERFAGAGEGAALASDWEHLTPYFYRTYVEGVVVNEADLRAVYVTGSLPWAESVFANLPRGPVYLSNYRREIRELGFRLRPEGELWRVLEPPAVEPVAPLYPLKGVWAGERVELLGYDLPRTEVQPGAVIPLVLYARVSTTETEILMPFAHFGEVEQRWATDSRRLTPEWRPDEIIAERYEIFVPYGMEPGEYALRLGYVDMTGGAGEMAFSGGRRSLALGEVTVVTERGAGRTAAVVERALTNLGNDVALMDARVAAGWERRRGLWEEPLRLAPGESFHVILTWRALARPRTSYTVFIHLIDASGRPWLGHDYTPLGGAFPSYLWFPKWLEGQQVQDPYRLVVPPGTPPGEYWLEVGMYEMGSVRRIPQLNQDGTMTGDRLVLGPVVVTP